MASVLEEVLRIVLETKGQEGLDALRKSLTETGDVSDETVAEVDRLIDQLTELNATAGKASRMGQLADDLKATGVAMSTTAAESHQVSVRLLELYKRSEELQAGYKGAKQEVERLGAAMKQEGADTKALGAAHKAAKDDVARFGAELKENEKGIKAFSAAQTAARAELEKIEGVYGKQAAALDKLDKELSESGRDTKDLAKLQDGLATEVASATAAIEKQAKAVQSESQATATLKQRLLDGDDAMRKFAQSGTASAEALKRYRAGADSAAAGSKNLADQGGRLTGMFNGLRGLIAPVLAYLSFDAAKQGIINLAGVASQAENARRALQNLYGGVDAGNRAYEGLRDMAKQSGLAFSDLVDDAKKLKAFGLDPLNGSLQALIDQNAAVGGSQQDLSGKVLALGQAWAKQKLQGEEILQLVERGVPVWSLLEKATGKNVQELQKLSEAGKLGRDVIQKLYEEIGRANTGAAERGLSSLSGLLAQVSARWQEFQQKVADSGVTEYFKLQIDALLNSTGSMDALAKKVADSIITVLDVVKTGAVFIANHVTAVKELAAAYLAFKVASAVNELQKWQAALIVSARAQEAAVASMGASSRAAGTLAGALGAIPSIVRISVLMIGAELAIRYGKDLGELLAKNTDLVKESEAAEERSRLSLYKTAAGYRDKAAALGQFATVTVLAADKVAALTETERKAYEASLEGEQKRLEALNGYYRAMEAAGALTADMGSKWQGVKDQIAGVTEALRQSGAAAEAAGAAVKKAAEEQSAAAAKAKQEYEDLRDAGVSAAGAIDGAFSDIKLDVSAGAQAAIDLFGKLSARGKEVAAVVRDELSFQLTKVAIHDLPALKVEAEKAMAAGKAGAVEFAAAVDTAIKSANFTKLGVDLGAIRTGFTEAGRSAVEAFKGAVKQVDELGLTVEQRSQAIAQAFDNAFRQASTKAELASLKVAIEEALASGDIGFAEFQERIDETDAKLAALSNTGRKVGEGVAEGASNASSALSSLSSSASGAAQGVTKAAEATGQANQAAKQGQGVIKSYALAWDGMNDAAARALQSLNKYLVNGMTGTHSLRYRLNVERLTYEMQRQLETVRKLTAAANEQNAAYDENEQKLIKLRQQYKWLADDELQALIDAEERLAENRKRAADEAQQQSEEAIARYREQGQAAAEAAKQAAESGSVLTGRSNPSAIATAEAAGELAEAATAITRASSSVAAAGSATELVLRVVAEPNQSGQGIQLSQQQIKDIAAAMIRALAESKAISS